MSPDPSLSAVVLLTGADAAALYSLKPAAEVLGSFGIVTQTVVATADRPASLPAGMCAVIVASPDAALPATLAKQTEVPVIRVPTVTTGCAGLSLLDDGNGQLPAGSTDGVFATMAVGEAGAKNAALFVVSSLAAGDERLRAAWSEFRARQTEMVLRHPALVLED